MMYVYLSPNLGEVSIALGIIQVQYLRGVVAEYPWKHGILVEVVVRSASNGVEEHEIVEVGYLPPQPLGCHGGLAVQLPGRSQRDGSIVKESGECVCVCVCVCV